MRIADSYRGFALDLDGTVYLGDHLLPGAAETIRALRDAGVGIIYLTNKPLDPSAGYAHKLTRLGLPTASEEVVSSLDALVDYLLSHHRNATVYCVSEPLVESVLSSAGFEIVTAGHSTEADVVVVSFDRTFDYTKLLAAYQAVNAGAVLVATNPDRFCPTPEGGLPDCAAMLAAIEAATGATAEAIVGKPSAAMAAAVVARLGLSPSQILMVGDRQETDVMLASLAGMDSALVLSGVAAAAAPDGPQPRYVLNGIAGLLEPAPRPITGER